MVRLWSLHFPVLVGNAEESFCEQLPFLVDTTATMQGQVGAAEPRSLESRLLVRGGSFFQRVYDFERVPAHAPLYS